MISCEWIQWGALVVNITSAIYCLYRANRYHSLVKDIFKPYIEHQMLKQGKGGAPDENRGT